MLTHAQTKDAALNSKLAAFIQANKDKDIEKIIDCMYPRIFELLPKEEMVDEMKKMAGNDKITVAMNSMKILNVDAITVSGPASFTRFKYASEIAMRIEIDSAKAKDGMGLMLEMFEMQYGKGNVTYEAATSTYNIKEVKYCLAIKDTYSKNQWTFMDIDKEGGAMIKKLLPVAAVKKYKI